MKLLIIKSLFIPNISFIEQNRSCINLFVEDLLNSVKNINACDNIYHFKLAGWINRNIPTDSKELKEFNIFLSDTKTILSKSHIYFDYDIWDKNYGKLYFFNTINKICPYYTKFDYVFYTDHDISPIDEKIGGIYDTSNTMIKSINDLCELIGTHLKNKEIVMISFDQIPDTRHNSSIYENKFTIKNFDIYYSDDSTNIASGAFLTVPKIISYIANLKSNNVYGDEDLLIGRMLNNKNYTNIISSIKINHPYDIDSNYLNWKRSTIADIVNYVNNNSCNKLFFS